MPELKINNTEIEILPLLSVLSTAGPVIFRESQSEDHSSSRRSFIAALPESTLKIYGNRIEMNTENGTREWEGNAWEALDRFYSESGSWMFGYFGYDLKNHTEDLQSENPDPVGAPDLYFMKPGLVLELKEGTISPRKGELPSRSAFVKNEQFLFEINRLRTTVPKKNYVQKILEAQRRIKEGDFYEINLSHQMKADFTGYPLGLYQKMKSIGPVPFGAFLRFDDISICCSSPERFLAKSGSRVFSQPIKGTSGRGKSAAEDEMNRQHLRESVKEQAENLMIVDLVRNDLAKVAKKGSVKVSGLFDIQSFETVHQMVSTIEARVDPGVNPIEIIKACFPMGSMTGAPKISVMKTIEELEEYKRGIYSGAIGYITPERDFDFNVVIRTAIIKGDQLFYSAGGAITSDSDPEAEWEETLLKSRALSETKTGNSKANQNKIGRG